MVKQINPNILISVKAIIFDFDGVICKDIFYSSLKVSYPIIHDYVEKQIFRSGTDLVDRWMRNEISSDDINRMISQANDIGFDLIKKIFEKDILNMKLDYNLLNFAKKLLKMNRKIALVTNNMDIFTTLTIPNHKLNEVFKVIVSSAEYGMLKTDQNGKLFDIAMDKLGINDYSSTLLIDDSLRVKPIFEAKGGNVYTYNNFNDFIKWTKDILK